MDSKNLYKRGMRLRSKQNGKVIVLVNRSNSIYWNAKCGKKTHAIHEGTLDKYFEII